MTWLCAGLGGAGVLLCCCSAMNIILACALCYHRRNSEWGTHYMHPSFYLVEHYNIQSTVRSHRENTLDLNYISSLPLRLRTLLS